MSGFLQRLQQQTCCNPEPNYCCCQECALSKVLKLSLVSPLSTYSFIFLISYLFHPHDPEGPSSQRAFQFSNEDRGARRLPTEGFNEDAVRELPIQPAFI